MIHINLRTLESLWGERGQCHRVTWKDCVGARGSLAQPNSSGHFLPPLVGASLHAFIFWLLAINNQWSRRANN